MRVLDLGAGTGSNLRGIAPILPGPQTWYVIDYDSRLLDHLWTHMTDVVTIRRQADLAQSLELVLAEASPDLVTAAAFFDLVSADWIARLVTAISRVGAPLYGTLIYTGEETWWPPHPADGRILSAFLNHQAGDKGLGKALGSRSAVTLVDALENAGFEVITGPSDWKLTSLDRALMTALCDGIANAVQETREMDQAAIHSWRSARKIAEACVIGHVDIFAVPR